MIEARNKHLFSILQPWLVWGTAAFFVLFQFLLQSSTSVMVNCLMHDLHVDILGVGVLSSSFFYSYLILQIPAGLLVDRYGPRCLLAFGIFICSIACVLFATADSQHTAELSRVLMGAVSAPGVVAAMYLASTWFPVSRFALLVGLTEMLGMLGGAVGEWYLARCVDGLGWRTTIMVCAAVSLFLAIMAWVIIRDRPQRQSQVANEKQRSLWEVVCDLRKVILKPQVWWSGIYAGFMFAVIAAFASLWSVPFLEKLYGIATTKAAVASAFVFLGAATGCPIVGWFSDRMQRRLPLMWFGALICAVVMVVVIWVPVSYAMMLLLLYVLGFSASTYVLPFALVRENTCATVRGTAMGFTNMMCIVLGAPILQPLIGWLLRHQQSVAVVDARSYRLIEYQYALSTLAVGLLVSLLVLVFIKETYCQQCDS